MLRGNGLLIASAALLALLPPLGGCTGEEFLVGVGGNDGTGSGSTGTEVASSGTDAGSTSSGSTTSTGGGCNGCLLGEDCQAGDTIEACGAAGAACQPCTTSQLCQVAACSDLACTTTPANEGDPCPYIAGDPTSGACIGGACQESPENCVDNEDNNQDGLEDCADPLCATAFGCVPNTPADWKGPVAVYFGAIACPGVWPTAAAGTYGIDIVAAGECDCACQESCTLDLQLGVDPVDGEGCDGTEVPTTYADGDGCVDLSAAALGQYAADAQSGGTCEGIENDSLPPATYDDIVTVCEGAVAGGGCDQGSCRAKAPAAGPIPGAVCIQREGEQTCPAGFGTRTVIDTNLDDQRSCGCSCTADCSSGSFELFGDSRCSDCGAELGACGSLAVDSSNPCADDLPATGTLYGKWSGLTSSCTIDDTEPEGEVVTTKLTLCCL